MQRESARILYSIKEELFFTLKEFLILQQLRHAKKHGHMSHQFIARIMLAVIEMNGCEICSYARAKWLLKLG